MPLSIGPYAALAGSWVTTGASLGTAAGTALGAAAISTGGRPAAFDAEGFLVACLLAAVPGGMLALVAVGRSSEPRHVVLRLGPASFVLPAASWFVCFLGIPV